MAIFEKTKTVVTQRRHLRATATSLTFAVNGELIADGAIVEVGMYESADLVGRKLAVDATLAEVAAAGENVIVANSRHDRWTDAS